MLWAFSYVDIETKRRGNRANKNDNWMMCNDDDDDDDDDDDVCM